MFPPFSVNVFGVFYLALTFFCQFFHLFIFTPAKLKWRAHVHRLCLGSSWQRWISSCRRIFLNSKRDPMIAVFWDAEALTHRYLTARYQFTRSVMSSGLIWSFSCWFLVLDAAARWCLTGSSSCSSSVDPNICHIVSTAQLILRIWLLWEPKLICTCFIGISIAKDYRLLNVRKRSSVLHISGETLWVWVKGWGLWEHALCSQAGAAGLLGQFFPLVRLKVTVLQRRLFGCLIMIIAALHPPLDSGEMSPKLLVAINLLVVVLLCLNLHIIHCVRDRDQNNISSFHRVDVKTNSPHFLTLMGK